MKLTVLILLAVVMPVVANAGDWFWGVYDWGIYTSQPGSGKWFLQLGNLALIPITGCTCAVSVTAIVGCVIFIFKRKRSRYVA